MTEITLTIPDWPVGAWIAVCYGVGLMISFMVIARSVGDGTCPDDFMTAVFMSLVWPAFLLAAPFYILWKVARIGIKAK